MADYCVYQDRCHWEVEKKMREYGLIPEARDEILLHLLQHDFLNEARFAKSYCRGKFYQKKWGKQKIKNGLRQRGITGILVEEGLQEIEEADYQSTLRELAKKKWQSLKREKPWQRKKKVQMYLYQRGFDNTFIFEVIKYIDLNKEE